MKAVVRFLLFGPEKSYEKLVFVVCGVTIQLCCHLRCVTTWCRKQQCIKKRKHAAPITVISGSKPGPAMSSGA